MAEEQSERFRVVEGSATGHCCFDASVVDTHVPSMIGGLQYTRKGVPQYEAVCECLDEEAAEMIARALNLAHAQGALQPVATSSPS